MSRKNTSKGNLQKLPKTPLYKQLWFVISAVAVVVSTIFLNGPTMLQNARIFPKEVTKTKKELMSWIKEDEQWTGHWSAFSETYADIEDMNISNVDMQINIWATEGDIDGTIATKKICSFNPIFDYVLLRGEVSGDIAHVIAWDVIQGRKTDFAELTLERDGEVLIITPVSGQTAWFPENARLVKTPIDSEKMPEVSEGFCLKERIEFLKKNPKNPAKG